MQPSKTGSFREAGRHDRDSAWLDECDLPVAAINKTTWADRQELIDQVLF